MTTPEIGTAFGGVLSVPTLLVFGRAGNAALVALGGDPLLCGGEASVAY